MMQPDSEYCHRDCTVVCAHSHQRLLSYPLLHAEMNGCLLFYLMALILVCLCEIAIAAVLVSLLADINVNHSGLGQY